MFTSRSFPGPVQQVNKFFLSTFLFVLDRGVRLWTTVIASKYVMDKWFLPFVVFLLMMVTSGFLCMFLLKICPLFEIAFERFSEDGLNGLLKLMLAWSHPFYKF